jgi:hypothetical protein
MGLASPADQGAEPADAQTRHAMEQGLCEADEGFVDAVWYDGTVGSGTTGTTPAWYGSTKSEVPLVPTAWYDRTKSVVRP